MTREMTRDLYRRGLAELLGTGLLVTVVVGSGIMAERLSPGNAGLELLENSTATTLGLAVLILALAPVSGAHFNPVVTLVDHLFALFARRAGMGADSGAGTCTSAGTTGRDVLVYIPAQIAGGIGGAVLANVMFALPAATASTHARAGGHLWLGETVATAGLILLIFALSRTGRGANAPAAVGAYIGAAYWFTSSTSFANPAVTIARAFTDTFAGIKPSSVPGFVLAQLVGAGIGALIVAALFPRTTTSNPSALSATAVAARSAS